MHRGGFGYGNQHVGGQGNLNQQSGWGPNNPNVYVQPQNSFIHVNGYYQNQWNQNPYPSGNTGHGYSFGGLNGSSQGQNQNGYSGRGFRGGEGGQRGIST